MALQLGALRDALIEAGASQEKADKAAEELAAYETRFDSIDRRLGSFGERLVAIEGRVTLLAWMVGGIYVVGLPALWLLVRIADKVGAIG